MTIYDLKPKFQALLRPLVQFLAANNVTANQITWLALILSLAYGTLITFFHTQIWLLIFLPLLMFIRMAFNAIDGMLAKEHDMKTDAGAILNEIADVLSDIALYLPFALIAGMPAMWIVLFTISAVISEFAGVLSWAVKQQRRYDGPMGKSDRAFVMGLLGLLLALGLPTGTWLMGLFALMTLLSFWTSYNRMMHVL